MKKTIMLLLVVALAFSCFALVFTAGAQTEVAQGTQPEGKNYFVTEAEYVRNLTFENNEVATGINADAVSGAYLALENGGSFDIVSDGAISGNKSLKVTNTGYAWATRLFYVNRFGSLLKNGETYRFSFSVKTKGATLITTEVRTSEATNDASVFLADFRYTIVNDADGNPVSVAKETGGWTGADQKYTNGSCVVENGVIKASFEFTIPADLQLAEDLPNAKITGANVKDGSATYIFDDIKIQNVSEGNKYWTIDYNADFETKATSASSFWSAIGKLSDEYTDSQAYVLDVEDAGTDTRGFLIHGQDGNGSPDPILKDYVGWIYFQYDVVTTSDDVAIWNGGAYWSEVNYKGEGWTIGGVGIKDFQAVKNGDGYTLSYFQRFEGNTIVNIKMQGPAFIAFDNLIVAHEDYAPYVENGKTYDYANTQDVAINVELKGKTLSAIKLDDVALEQADYTLEGNTLTVKAAKLASQTLGTAHTLEVVTDGGATKVQIAQNDNRPTVTVTASGSYTKEYDGTTTIDLSDITYSVEGLADGAKVQLDKTVGELASKNAGTSKVTVTLALSGDDAWQYKLATTSVEIDVTITKKNVTVQVSDTTKVYDGTTDANATLTVNGLVGNDQVTATATQTLASKNAGETKLNLTDIALDGADKDNYALTATTAEVDFTVTKKAITVKANAVSKEEKQADPELTYTVEGLVSGDALSGALARAEGEKAGEYDITVGTLANDNYTITFTGAKLTINAAKGCFGVVGAASIGVFALIAAGAYVFTRKKND